MAEKKSTLTLHPDEAAFSIKWEVTPKGLDIGHAFMNAGCHHRPGKFGACGGCYARMYQAMQFIADGADGKKLANLIFEASKREAPAKKKPKSSQ